MQEYKFYKIFYNTKTKTKKDRHLDQINKQMAMKQKLQAQLAIDVQLHQHIILVSSLLKDLIADNKNQDQPQTQPSSTPTVFDSKSIPDISIDDYLRRVHKLTRFSPESLIMAVVIMDRYMVENQDFTLNWINVHRLLLSCLILGVKIHDDFYYDNKAFQTAGGVNVIMLEKYQIEIFQKCKYNLFVDQEQYNIFVENLYSVYANPNDDQSETQEEF